MTPSLCQIEIKTPDLAASLAFAKTVFAWQVAPIEMHDYTVIDVPKECPYGIAFIRSRQGERSTHQNTLYFRVEDIQDTLTAVKDSGGRVRFGPKEVPGLGTIYHVEDPAGVVYGLFSPRSP